MSTFGVCVRCSQLPPPKNSETHYVRLTFHFFFLFQISVRIRSQVSLIDHLCHPSFICGVSSFLCLIALCGIKVVLFPLGGYEVFYLFFLRSPKSTMAYSHFQYSLSDFPTVTRIQILLSP